MDSYLYSDGRWQHLLTAKSCGFIYYMTSLKCFRALQSFLCFIALSQLLSIYEQCKYVNPTLSICPALPSALPMSMYPFSMSESIPSLEIDSSVPFFQILYICSVMSQRGRMGQWVGERFKKKGRWEGESGWGTHVNPWLIHVNVQQKPLQYCKVISLQLIKINEKTKKQKTKEGDIYMHRVNSLCCTAEINNIIKHLYSHKKMLHSNGNNKLQLEVMD